MPRVKRDVEYVQRLSSGLAEANGVRSVRVNAAAASVVVMYDAQTVSFEMLVELIVTPPVRAAPILLPTQRSWRAYLAPVVSGALGLALALFGAPVPVTAAFLALSAAPVASTASRDLAGGRLSVDTLDTIAIVVLALRGSMRAASLSAFLIASGELIRALTARRSQAAIVDLFGTSGRRAWVLRDGRTERVRADTLVPGETVVVYPGELILVDGLVTSGVGSVDQKSLTGESKPALRSSGDEVFASTMLTEGKLHVRVERAGTQTRASRIVQLLAGAPVHETAIANYAGRFADRFVLPVLLSACGIFVLTRDPMRAAAVIVFDFATGIRVAVPTTVLAAMSAAVRRNILIKGGRALEKLAQVDTIVFDKTGTLTEGMPHVVDVGAVDGTADLDEILALAAGAEHRLTHPVAHAIVERAQSRGLAIVDVHDSDYAIGLGVSAWVNGDRVMVGSEQHLVRVGMTVPALALEAAARAGARGESTVFVARGEVVMGWIAYADVARVEAPEVIRLLGSYGVRDLAIVTGDQPAVAAAVAATLGIEHVEAQVFPEGKAEIVRALQRRGRTVAVVGDGINDSPALAYADVAVSLKDGSDAARETADVVLHGDLRGLTEAIDIARHAMRTVYQDLAIVGVPNALGFVLAAVGIISPTIATALNNGSGVAAALNGLRPLSYRPGGARGMRQLEEPGWTTTLNGSAQGGPHAEPRPAMKGDTRCSAG